MDQMNSGLGQFAAALNPGTASKFQEWQLEYYGSIAAIVLGGLLFIGGIIQQTQKK
jgi:predicted ABC-type sugar transport system permease subunit